MDERSNRGLRPAIYDVPSFTLRFKDEPTDRSAVHGPPLERTDNRVVDRFNATASDSGVGYSVQIERIALRDEEWTNAKAQKGGGESSSNVLTSILPAVIVRITEVPQGQPRSSRNRHEKQRPAPDHPAAHRLVSSRAIHTHHVDRSRTERTTRN